jgi:hypothetical protein
VATAVAKSAIKSYATGQVLGVIAEISELQAVADTVTKVQEIQNQAKSLETTANGIVLVSFVRLLRSSDFPRFLAEVKLHIPAFPCQVAENNVEQGVRELSKGLSGIQSDALGEVQAIAGDVNKAVSTLESLPAIINGEINALTNQAIAYAVDVDVVKKVRLFGVRLIIFICI